MIITRAPFRISFFGGGTDAAWFYQENGGMVISATINKHVYVSCHPMFHSEEVLLKYSEVERVSKVSEIKHRIFRETLTLHGISGVDIGVSSDVPAGTGLGSSSSFTVALLQCLRRHKGLYSTAEILAREASEIEIVKLGQIIGKQDQYAAAYGGLNRITFSQDDQVKVEPIKLSNGALEILSKSFVCIKVGGTREASSVLNMQRQDYENKESSKLAHQELLALTKSIPDNIFEQLPEFGRLLNESWNIKKQTSLDISNTEIDDLIMKGLKNGALGAKLLGAGQAGFVLFLVEPESKEFFINAFQNRKIMTVQLDFEGSKIVYDNKE